MLLASNPNTFWTFSKNFKSDTNCVTLKKFHIFVQNTNISIIANNLNDFPKNFKSDTFENYNNFEPFSVFLLGIFFLYRINYIQIFCGAYNTQTVPRTYPKMNSLSASSNIHPGPIITDLFFVHFLWRYYFHFSAI